MKGFKFLNFHTVYSSKGTVNQELGSYACYSDIFHADLIQKNSYHIYVYQGMNLFNQGQSNGCFLELDDIKRHLNTLKHLVNISFNITEHVDKNLNPYYDIAFSYSGYNIYHRFILTWIRALYEFPYCIYLPEVYALKNEPEFKFINPFNLLNIVTSCYYDGDDIHMFTQPGFKVKILKYNGIRQSLYKNKTDLSLFSIFSTDTEIPDSKSLTDDFLNLNLLHQRKPIYIQRYKLFKYGV